MAFILFIFFIAALISSVAAYFSIIGLGSIFAATFWGVVIMGGSLEVGKIVTAKWIHANWRNPSATWYFRGLLCFFVACLMAITSLGIYGYLSRGHLEQQAPLAGLSIQVEQLEQQIKQKQDENTQLNSRLSQMGRITEANLTKSGASGLYAANVQKRDSGKIQTQIDANNQVINDLTTKLVPLKMKTSNVQGELGVAKFIAEALGWDPEKAIRIMISLIMAAFDPLAISMFIMGSISLKDHREKKDKPEGEVEDKPTEVETPEVVEAEIIETIPAEAEIEDAAFTEVEPQETIIDEPVSVEPVPELDIKPEPFMEALNDELKVSMLLELEEEISQLREQRLKELSDELALLNDHVGNLEQQKADMVADREALDDAHQQLLAMEERLKEEYSLLQEWEAQLTIQQQTINNWRPMIDTPDGQKTPKDHVIDLLAQNPEIVNDIVQVAESLRQNRPGL